MVPVGERLDLDLEDLPDLVAVHTVDDKLHAGLEEGILELGDLSLEGKHPLLAGDIGEAGEGGDQGVGVGDLALQRHAEHLRDELPLLGLVGDERGAQAADEHEDHRRGGDQGAKADLLEDRCKQKRSQCHEQADGERGDHQEFAGDLHGRCAGEAGVPPKMAGAA